jgi:hypothetical protein
VDGSSLDMVGEPLPRSRCAARPCNQAPAQITGLARGDPAVLISNWFVARPLELLDPEADIHELRMATQKRPHVHPAISDANSMRVE